MIPAMGCLEEVNGIIYYIQEVRTYILMYFIIIRHILIGTLHHHIITSL